MSSTIKMQSLHELKTKQTPCNLAHEKQREWCAQLFHRLSKADKDTEVSTGLVRFINQIQRQRNIASSSYDFGCSKTKVCNINVCSFSHLQSTLFLGTLYVFQWLPFSFQPGTTQMCRTGGIITSQKRKLRPREARWLVKNHSIS